MGARPSGVRGGPGTGAPGSKPRAKRAPPRPSHSHGLATALLSCPIKPALSDCALDSPSLGLRLYIMEYALCKLGRALVDLESDGITGFSDGGRGYAKGVSSVNRASSQLRAGLPVADPCSLASGPTDLGGLGSCSEARFSAHVFGAVRGPQTSRARAAEAASDPWRQPIRQNAIP